MLRLKAGSCMQDSKKAIIVSVTYVLILILVSLLILEPYYNTDYLYTECMDRKYRDSLSGSIDYIILGASNGQNALSPTIIDERLCCNSYNLSSPSVSFRGRRALLDEEINRNSIKDVIIEVSYNTLERNRFQRLGSSWIVPRLSSISSRLKYVLGEESIYNYDVIYAYNLSLAIFVGKHILFVIKDNIGNLSDIVGIISKECSGFEYKKDFLIDHSNDLTYSSVEAKEVYNSEKIADPTEYEPDNIVVLSDIIKECQERGCRVSLVVTPVSDAVIWRSNGWDGFYEYLKSYAKKKKVTFYGFNLLRNRYKLFNDRYSFSDDNHMSDKGAKAFTEEYCKIMKMNNLGQDTSDLFYKSYRDMKLDSPYANRTERIK